MNRVKILMGGIVQKIPVLFPFLVPFPEVTDFISHEVQFFARMGVHIHIK